MSRVAFPALKTASTLLNVSLLSETTGSAEPGRRGAAASSSMSIRLPGKRPPVSDISAALMPPFQNPLLNAGRMLRVRYRSSRMYDPLTSRSYSPSRAREVSSAFSAS